ncbi:Ethanol acetyltransferase 1 [Dissostichus eleginoides]|uniref:Ethanol acetyltransferase 1 n=1 Tax=Dissostichus eleginoides TaxID=100907 RepID=A0AAD9BXQ8_DISEL|nr:Ethanol acetyltransferase 1 [Dissostichus eleginoides]
MFIKSFWAAAVQCGGEAGRREGQHAMPFAYERASSNLIGRLSTRLARKRAGIFVSLSLLLGLPQPSLAHTAKLFRPPKQSAAVNLLAARC